MVYYVTDEEDRFVNELAVTLKDYLKKTWVFNAVFGLVNIEELQRDWKNRTHRVNTEARDIHAALEKVYKDDPREEQHFYIITDPERWLKDPHVVRRLLNIVHQLHNDIRTVKILIFVGPRLAIPETLSRYMEVVHDHGLDQKATQELVEQLCGYLRIKPPVNSTKMFSGLTSYEVEAAVAQSIVQTKQEADPARRKRIDPKFVADYKRRRLRKTDLLQLTEVGDSTFDTIGGNDRFKEWANKTKAAWTDEGSKFGLKPPKGVLLVGVWGCGKSICAKSMGSAWNLPVVSMEMGKLRSSAVGESESNVYRATRLIESVAPCVTGETEVTLADGSTRPIEELWQDTSDNLRVMCWDEKALKVTTTSVRAVTRRRAEAFSIAAANGFGLNATVNHEHYVLRGGMPEWVRTDELEPGDMLAVPLERYSGSADCERFHPKGMCLYERPADSLPQYRRGGGGYRDCVVDALPSQWNEGLGWLLGAIEGDGYLGTRDAIGMVNSSKAILNEFERVMLDSFGLQPIRQETDNSFPDLPGVNADSEFKTVWDSKVTNGLAAEFLRNAREAILTAPPSVRASFLAGWIDTDGCIQPDKVILTVKGPKLRHERRMLARQLIQSLGVTPSKFDGVNMEITGSRAQKLAGLLIEFLVLKKNKASCVQASDLGFDRGMGFACASLLSEARKKSTVSIEKIQREGLSTGVMWRHEKGITPISERYLRRYTDVLGDAAQNLRQLLNAPCRWVEIRSINGIGEQDVYDLVCEGENTHSFFANGMVTHNCVVWIDEAEKSLSGSHSSSQSDAGTTSRTIGILSNWLQETEAKVCLVMTANSLKTLPVEFVNRMDERFFFDLPNEEERIAILKIHLLKKGQDPGKFQLADLAEAAKKMVGREIEQAIGAAMVDSFEANCKALDSDILLKTLSTKPRIFKTMEEDLREIVDWVGYDEEVDEGIRARFASNRRSESFQAVIDAEGTSTDDDED